MTKFLTQRLFVICLSIAIFIAWHPPAMGAEKVGNAAAVRGDVQLAAISGVRKVGKKIASGEPIFLGDRVTTGPKGRLQIMLLDETVFTIGPRGAIVIDEFVYDPNTSKGKIVASVLKGTFRFVTGKVARRDPKKMVVKLPVGSIGVRGTSVAGHTDGVSATVVLLGPGANTNTGERVGSMTVSGLGAARSSPPVTIVRPGFATQIAGFDQPPSPAIRMAAGRLSTIINQLSGPSQRSSGPASESARGGPGTGPITSGGAVMAESGDRRARGRRGVKINRIVKKATNPSGDEEESDLPPLAGETLPELPPDPLQLAAPGDSTTFGQLRSITSGTANFLGPPRPILVAGTPAGQYQVGYSYNFGTRTATGGVTITVGPPFATPGTGTFPLLAGPFADLTRTGPVEITETVGPGPSPLTATIGGQATFQYKFLNTNGVIFSELAHRLTYTKGATGKGDGKLTR